MIIAGYGYHISRFLSLCIYKKIVSNQVYTDGMISLT